jgi:hypothetical protein
MQPAIDRGKSLITLAIIVAEYCCSGQVMEDMSGDATFPFAIQAGTMVFRPL